MRMATYLTKDNDANAEAIKSERLQLGSAWQLVYIRVSQCVFASVVLIFTFPVSSLFTTSFIVTLVCLGVFELFFSCVVRGE